MQALILVGGHGTRLRPVTLTLPKPVIPLVDRPFIRYMIDWLARHGVDDIVMACGFLPDGIRAVLGDGIPGGPRLRYVEEPEPRGTAGAMKFAADLLDDRFFALNGDVLTDLDLTGLMERHTSSGARATLALYPVDDPSHYGLVRRREDGEISGFLEKPEPAEIDTDEVNAGAYVLEKEVLDLVPEDRDVSIERDLFPQLVGNGLYSRRLEGYWMDIGTPERYLQACWDILAREVETEPGAMVDERGTFVSPDADVDPDAEIGSQAFVEADAVVAGGAVIGSRAVIGAGASIGEGARVVASALHPACRIGAGATVEGSILAAGAILEEGAVVPEGSIVGAGATITAETRLEPGARVQPEETAAR
jgi:mannose-1-phosphate guanylyltransferase